MQLTLTKLLRGDYFNVQELLRDLAIDFQGRRSGRRLHRVGKATAGTDVGTKISFWEAHDRWLV